jgi:hypothetical protein
MVVLLRRVGERMGDIYGRGYLKVRQSNRI